MPAFSRRCIQFIRCRLLIVLVCVSHLLNNVCAWLPGMGCSAGIIAVDAASRLLQLTPNKYALVVSTENMTQNW